MGSERRNTPRGAWTEDDEAEHPGAWADQAEAPEPATPEVSDEVKAGKVEPPPAPVAPFNAG